MPVQSKKVHGCKSRKTTSSSELAKLTRNAKVTKWEWQTWERWYLWDEIPGMSLHKRQDNKKQNGRCIVFQKCWSVRCDCGLRENLKSQNCNNRDGTSQCLCSLHVQRSSKAQWTRALSMRKQWMKDADILQGQQRNVLWNNAGRMGRADHDRSPIQGQTNEPARQKPPWKQTVSGKGPASQYNHSIGSFDSQFNYREANLNY